MENNTFYLEKLLVEMKCVDLNAYNFSVKVINDALENSYISTIDKAFESMDSEICKIYKCTKEQDTFALYTGLQYSPLYEYYMCIHSTGNAAAFYATRKYKIIAHRKYCFASASIKAVEVHFLPNFYLAPFSK
jgi:hypothetical protein